QFDRAGEHATGRAGPRRRAVCPVSPPHQLSVYPEPSAEPAGTVEPVGETVRAGAPALLWGATAARNPPVVGPYAEGIVVGCDDGGAVGSGDEAGCHHEPAPGPEHHRIAH